MSHKVQKLEDQSRHVEVPRCLMIRNIPCRCSQETVLAMVAEMGFADAYDFFYMPMRLPFTKPRNFGYAFINMISDDKSLELQERMSEGVPIRRCANSHKRLGVGPAHIQGIENLTAHFAKTKACVKASWGKGPVGLQAFDKWSASGLPAELEPSVLMDEVQPSREESVSGSSVGSCEPDTQSRYVTSGPSIGKKAAWCKEPRATQKHQAPHAGRRQTFFCSDTDTMNVTTAPPGLHKGDDELQPPLVTSCLQPWNLDASQVQSPSASPNALREALFDGEIKQAPESGPWPPKSRPCYGRNDSFQVLEPMTIHVDHTFFSDCFY